MLPSAEATPVIRQICPHCFNPVELADDAAGANAECPACHKTFAVPGRYTPSVAGDAPPRPAPEPAPVPDPVPVPADPRPAPPPGLVLPSVAPAGAPTFGGTAPPPDGPTHSATLTLSPVVLDWLPVTCLTLVFVLTFFSWVGLYPGGYTAYSQTPWGALAGAMTTNHFSEEVLKIETPLKKLLPMNVVLMLPYLLGLVAAVAIGWADRLIRAAYLNELPGPLNVLRNLWPVRFTVITGLAVATLLLLLLQTYLDFSLEEALKKFVAADFTDKLAAADNSSARQKLLVEQGKQLGQYELQTTVWLTLAVLLHVTAVVAAALRLWLTRRGDKPLPRVVFWS